MRLSCDLSHGFHMVQGGLLKWNHPFQKVDPPNRPLADLWTAIISYDYSIQRIYKGLTCLCPFTKYLVSWNFILYIIPDILPHFGILKL